MNHRSLSFMGIENEEIIHADSFASFCGKHAEMFGRKKIPAVRYTVYLYLKINTDNIIKTDNINV